MNHKEFNDLVKRRMRLTQVTLASKAAEYADDGERLHNFKRAGQVLGTTPEAALLGFLTKHLVSLMDIIDGLDENQQDPLKKPEDYVPSQAVVDEKIGDCISYLILLEGLLAERIFIKESPI